jgi:TonB family protein
VDLLLVGCGKRQFCSSLTASAMFQCLFVIFLLWLCRTTSLESEPTTRFKAENFQVTRIIYPVKVPSQMLSDKVGGLTGVRNVPQMTLSHPSLPRATAPQQLTDLDTLGDWPQSIPVQTLHIPMVQPRLPTDKGLLTTMTYHSGRLLKTPQVQVGGFTSPVLLADLNATGLTSKRHHGVDVTEFGDGFGNGGGRVVLPVRIISKPKPTYTDEARSQKIEGEVVVDVMFHANGFAEVLGIVERLGYGLDNVAVNAVQHMKFRPALVNGKAVDSQGRAHVEFHLFSSPLISDE